MSDYGDDGDYGGYGGEGGSPQRSQGGRGGRGGSGGRRGGRGGWNGGGRGNGYPQYGGNEAEGGGFMPGEGSGEQKKGPKREAQAVIPLTIKQVHDAQFQDQTLTIDGKEASNIHLVARIVSIESSSVDHRFILEDGTGTLTMTVWSESDGKFTELREGQWIRATGSVKTQAGGPAKYLSPFGVNPIKDFNEITYHLADCIYAHVKTKYGNLPPGGVASSNSSRVPLGSSASNNNNSSNSSSSSSGFYNNQGKGQTISMDTTSDNLNTPQGLAKAVLKVFANDTSGGEQGTEMTVVFKAFPQVSPQDIRKAVEMLSEEGHLYSTIDEDHFKCTGGN